MNYKRAIFIRVLIVWSLCFSGLLHCYKVQAEAAESQQTLLQKAHMLQMRTAIQHADLKSIDAETFKSLPYEIKLEFLVTLQNKIGKLDSGNFSFYMPMFFRLLIMEAKSILLLFIKKKMFPQGVNTQNFFELSSIGEYGLYLLAVLLFVPDFSEFIALISKRAEIYNYENYDVRAPWIKDYENCLAIRELLQKADPDLFLQIQES